METGDDGALLREYVENNSNDAFAALVARHVNLVYSVSLRRAGNAHHAEEITQAVFVILAKKAPQLRHHAALSSWLFQTARLTACNFVRSETRRQHREQEAYMQSTLNESGSETWAKIAPLLDEAVEKLGEKDRRAIVLRFYEGRDLREVCVALGSSEDAAEKRVGRAVEKLRKLFKKRGAILSAAGLTAAISANSVQAAPPLLTKTAVTLALTNGATASASTAAVIEGGLKLMAWTKIKSAAVAAVAVVLAAGMGTVVVKTIHRVRVAQYPNLTGTWEVIMPLGGVGTAKGEQTGTRIVVHFLKTNGDYAATADAIDLGQNGRAVGVAYDYPAIQLLINPRTTFEGKVNAKASQIVFDNSVFMKRASAPTPIFQPLAEADFTSRAGSDLQGYWKGEINISEHPDGLGDRQLGDWSKAISSSGAVNALPDILPVNLKIVENADGTFRADLDSPMQGALGQPVLVTYDRPSVKLGVTSNSGKFEGYLSTDQQEMKGFWIQGQHSVPATFKRADYQAELARDGARDYSFSSKSDLRGHWKGSWRYMKVDVRLVLNVATLPDGTYHATLANLDQLGNEAPIPASDIQYSSPNARLEWKWAGGAFEGKLKDGKLVGTWLEGGGGFPLVFERTGK